MKKSVARIWKKKKERGRSTAQTDTPRLRFSQELGLCIVAAQLVIVLLYLLWTWKQTTFPNNESLLPFPLIPRYIHWCLQSYTSALTFPNPSLCVCISLSVAHPFLFSFSVLFCLTFYLLRVHSLVVGVMEVASNPQITHIQHKYIQKAR